MAKTAKEKQRDYRERRKLSGKAEQDKEKDRLRKKKTRNEMKQKYSKREWQIYRKKENERVKLSKLKTKVIQGESSTIASYKSPQALGKAIRRVQRTLPKSPRKQKSVVTAIAKSVGLNINDNISKFKLSNKTISVECEMAVKEYFLRDDVTWQAPGKKDRVIIRDTNEDGSLRKVYLQKRYLRMSMKETHQCFLKDNPNFPISLTSFSKLKPTEVDFFGNLPHSVCMCSYHENFRLILEALKLYVDLPVTFREFIDLVTCDSNEKSCMNRECNTCKMKIDTYDPKNVVPDAKNILIKLYQWKKVEGVTKKEVIEINLENLFELLKEQLKPFLIHTYVKRIQSNHFENSKKEVNSRKIVLQVDFSENFAFKYQNEIQSAHWANSQCTLFTGYSWIKEKEGKSYVLVSECLDHSKISIFSYMMIILKDLKNSFPDIEEVAIFSDGVSSQFKQRFLFSNLYLFEKLCNLKLTWNYFATSHGKGTVDGIGGAVKGSVWRRILANNEIVDSAKKFVSVAKQCNEKIHIQHVSTNQIYANSKILEERWKQIKPVPNTHRIHMVKSIDEYKILVSDESLGPLKNQKIVNLIEDNDSEIQNGHEKENLNETIKLGSFVKVKLASKRREQYFIAQITSMKSDGYDVRYLKHTENDKVFIDDDPQSYYIDYNDIKMILPVPTIDNRGRYHFKTPVLVE